MFELSIIVSGVVFGLFFGFRVEVVVVLEMFYYFVVVDIEFFGVMGSELMDGESLVVEIGIEGDGVFVGVDLDIIE